MVLNTCLEVIFSVEHANTLNTPTIIKIIVSTTTMIFLTVQTYCKFLFFTSHGGWIDYGVDAYMSTTPNHSIKGYTSTAVDFPVQ